MGIFAAYATIEEIGLQILENREKIAAGSIPDDLPARADSTTGQSS